MSSMRNALQRRNHKERAQPKERERWGLLEKHKDYALRAQDYNAKKSRIKALRTKAAERNPDEFHHGMLSGRTSKGRRIADRGNPALAPEAVKLLKTQDSTYLRAMIQQTQKQIARLEEDFVLQPQSGNLEAWSLNDQQWPSNRLVFCEDSVIQGQEIVREESCQEIPRAKVPSRIDQAFATCKSRRQAERDKQRHKANVSVRRANNKAKAERKAMLAALKQRNSHLLSAEEELESQRARMSRTIGGTNKAGTKFRLRERKK